MRMVFLLASRIGHSRYERAYGQGARCTYSTLEEILGVSHKMKSNEYIDVINRIS